VGRYADAHRGHTVTSTSSPAPPACTPTQPALNYTAIRARAAEFGMLETTLNELTAVTLGTGGVASTGSPWLRLRLECQRKERPAWA
jgi:hypothetical protein